MPFELVSSEDGDSIKATGMTRAGLLESALKGTFAAAGAKIPEGGKEITRQFAIRGADFDALLAAFLDHAIALSSQNREAYQAVKFDLITVMEAKGAFVGKPAESFSDPLKSVARDGLKAERNAEGAWESEIKFER